MEIKPIRTEADYEAALKEIEKLMESQLGAPDGDRLEVLVTLVDAYEAEHFPIPEPDDPVTGDKRTHSARRPRQGWGAQFSAMAEHGDDRLLDETVPPQWDQNEWTW